VSETGHERAPGEELRHFKPGVREQIEEHGRRTDLSLALQEGDAEKVKELITSGRRHTYDAELAKRGIDRLDDEYLRAFEYALVWLYEHRPFYAFMFDEIVRKETFDIDTLCVTIRQGRIEMWYNPDFLAIHNLRENVGFLQHEMGHIAHEHLLMQKDIPVHVRASHIFAIAIDLAVDSLIQSEGDQPPWVLLPSMLRIPDDDKPEEEWATFKERQTWDYYYRLLKDMEENFPQQFQQQVVMVAMGRPQSGPPQAGGGKGEQQEGEDGEKQEGKGEKGEDEGKGHGRLTMDDHSHWNDGEADSPDIQEEVIKQTVKQAFTKAESAETSMHGYMSGELIARIQELLREKSVPFERVFRRFVGRHMTTTQRPTMIRVSRRRKVPPGKTTEKTLRILWAQDDSGSVPPEARALCRSELWHAIQDTNVEVLFQRFTYGLAGPLLDLRKVDFKEAQREYDGGTDFQAVCDLAEELDVDLLLIATDGFAPTPKKPKVPMGWILTHDGREHPWGMVIRLPTVADIKKGYKAKIERWMA
jgi:predicted metal-dependent peptidase